jgi:hypothetical protein
MSSSYRQRDYESRSGSSSRKRTRSRSPPPWRKEARKDDADERRRHDRNMKEQSRLNALQEAEQAREWVNQEDQFVLKQAKKKAEIRVKEGRAKPIDWLAVNLRVIDKDRNPLDDEIQDEDLDVVDPESILEGLDIKELEDLQKDIEVYIDLETNRTNNEFWRVCPRPPFPSQSYFPEC